MTTKTPKTLTLSTKKPRAEAAPLTVPKTTLSYVIDNAQEAAGKVTVVKKKTSRLAVLPGDEPVTVEPMRAFPRLRDLVTDVSVNFRMKKSIRRFQPRPRQVALPGDLLSGRREAREQLPVEYSGSALAISFNAQYVLDFLNVVETDIVSLSLKDEVSQAYKRCREGLFDDYVFFWPIVHDALRNSHSGPMTLLHGGKNAPCE